MKAWLILFYTVIPQTNNIFIWGCKTPSYNQISYNQKIKKIYVFKK